MQVSSAKTTSKIIRQQTPNTKALVQKSKYHESDKSKQGQDCLEQNFVLESLKKHCLLSLIKLDDFLVGVVSFKNHATCMNGHELRIRKKYCAKKPKQTP